MMCGPVKAIPEGHTIYDKVVVNQGPLTFQKFIDHFKNTMNLEVTMIIAGKIALYNVYIPGNKHALRLPLNIETTFEDLAKEKITRNYLVLEIGGTTADGSDFQMPPIKYIFA
jgi:hypothetical protein